MFISVLYNNFFFLFHLLRRFFLMILFGLFWGLLWDTLLRLVGVVLIHILLSTPFLEGTGVEKRVCLDSCLLFRWISFVLGSFSSSSPKFPVPSSSGPSESDVSSEYVVDQSPTSLLDASLRVEVIDSSSSPSPDLISWTDDFSSVFFTIWFAEI